MDLPFEWPEPTLHNEIIGEHSDREHFVIVPDEKTAIRQQIRQWVSEDIPFIFTTGGTGPGPRDTTVGAVRELLECEAPGIAEAMRSYGRLVLGQARSFGAGEVPLEQAFGRVFVGSVRADRDYPLFLVLQWTDLRRFLPIWTRVLGSGGVLWDPAGYASQYAGPATCGQRGPGTGRSRSLLSHLISRYYRTFK